MYLQIKFDQNSHENEIEIKLQSTYVHTITDLKKQIITGQAPQSTL